MKNIAGYIRVSSSKQKDNYSMPYQKSRIEEYCKFHFSDEEYSLTIHEDSAKTARNLKREGVRNLLNRELDVVIIYKIDRLCRNLKDLLQLVHEFKERNIEVIFLKENVDTSTAVGKLIMHILGAFAEFESDTIGERALMGMIGTCCNGEYPFLRAPYGYVMNADNKLIKDDKISHKLEYAIDLLKRLNLNVKETARTLASEYHEKERTWEHRLENVIEKKLYSGTFEFHDEEYTDIVIDRYLQDPLVKHQQNIYEYLNEDIICDTCGTKLTNSSAINRKKNVYLYKFCKKCRKRVRDDYITDLIKLEKKYIHEKVISKVKHFRYDFKSKRLTTTYR